MAFNVTAALKLDDMNNIRPRLSEKVRELRRKDQLPQLTKLDSFGQWVTARHNYSFDGTYSLAFLATDFLVAHHSFARVADFFRRFETSNDHLANFKEVFGESVEDFERRLQVHFNQLLK